MYEWRRSQNLGIFLQNCTAHTVHMASQESCNIFLISSLSEHLCPTDKHAWQGKKWPKLTCTFFTAGVCTHTNALISDSEYRSSFSKEPITISRLFSILWDIFDQVQIQAFKYVRIEKNMKEF